MVRRILLVSSSFEEVSLVTASKKNPLGLKTTDDSHYPLGIAYLHACLERVGYQVKTLFLNNYSFAECFEKTKVAIKDFSPDIIGYQILTTNRISSYLLIEFVNTHYQSIQQVIGGIHTTIMYRQLLNKYPFLIAVLGEGEITFPELIKELSKEKPCLNEIDGIAFCQAGAIVTTKPRGLIENLDELPLPKHELFFHPKRTTANILTARGCPFNCSFCCLDQLSQRRVRKRSINNIIEEIEWLIKQYPRLTDVWIHDDTFFIDNNRVIALCDEIIKKGIKLKFTCSGRMKPLSPELIRKLEAAGFYKVLFGLESGDNGILKRCHKNITQNDAIAAFKLFAGSNITVFAFLIVGLPGETRTTILETSRLIRKLQKIKYVHYHSVATLTIYPGTEVYEIAKSRGFINDDYWLTDQPTPIFTVENDFPTLLEFQEMLLNRISLNRLFTSFSGFIFQLPLLPQIIKYTFKDRATTKNILYLTLVNILPGAWLNFLLKIRKKFKSLINKS